MRYIDIAVLSVMVACAPHKPSPTPEPTSAPATSAPPVVAPVEGIVVESLPGDPDAGVPAGRLPAEGVLVLEPAQGVVGAALTFRFMRSGRNGCYHQSDVSVETSEREVTFSYTTWEDQGTDDAPVACVAMIPMGGFIQSWTPETAGEWTAHVVVDGQEVRTQRFDVRAADAQED